MTLRAESKDRPSPGGGASWDAQLLQASIGDPDRFAELHDRHSGRLYGYAHRRVGPISRHHRGVTDAVGRKGTAVGSPPQLSPS